ncbi:hypothetical protein B4902_00720 [Yersinia frederiksenii]|uniref:hypothetical protein n=1 Tax=Yersinia frederiksenii TaxID=29484 RepID=UPI000B48E650|nr:hypothetical protein [Yersinia frederiksenii]OWF74681.1 hypothetical protein B4902_00720 [Yersinia frederiksenii]HEC1651078.1 hypothetical protein [Yersinia enterocolitica]HEI6964575.1 hypothetical protein [Yersinia enterocolitica]
MAIKLTARDIKVRVLDMARRQCGKRDVSTAYWMKKRIAEMKAREAAAYLTDSRYEVSPRAKAAIENWITDLKCI